MFIKKASNIVVLITEQILQPVLLTAFDCDDRCEMKHFFFILQQEKESLPKQDCHAFDFGPHQCASLIRALSENQE